MSDSDAAMMLAAPVYQTMMKFRFIVSRESRLVLFTAETTGMEDLFMEPCSTKLQIVRARLCPSRHRAAAAKARVQRADSAVSALKSLVPEGILISRQQFFVDGAR